MNLDESLREIMEDFHFGLEHHNAATYTDPTEEAENQARIKDCNDKRVEAIAKIKALVVDSLPKGIKYIAEINGIRIAVNEAMRGTEWQLKSKEEIESYNQCLGEIKSIWE